MSVGDGSAHPDEHELMEFAEASLTASRRETVLHHLDVCERCRAIVSELSQENTYVRRDGDPSSDEHEPVGDPLVNAQVGEYRVMSLLSRGGMGAVYRGVHPVIGKQVAIKVLLPHAAADAELGHRLLLEARAVNAVRHPNIIDVFSFGELPDGRNYFVMELLEGQSLSTWLQTTGPLEIEQVLTVLEQSMAALNAAHGAGVVHRDLKLGNLFASLLPDKKLHITVLDFGIAKSTLNRGLFGTAPGVILGTAGYMAPEQIRGDEVGPAADVYAMGAVAWRLLTGEWLFDAEAELDILKRHLDEPVPALKALRPSVPASLESLLQRMLAKEPAARPDTAEVRKQAIRISRELSEARTVLMKAVGAPTQKTAPVTAPALPPVKAVPATRRVERVEATARIAAPAAPVPWRALVLTVVLLGLGLGAAAWWRFGRALTAPSPAAGSTDR